MWNFLERVICNFLVAAIAYSATINGGLFLQIFKPSIRRCPPIEFLFAFLSEAQFKRFLAQFDVHCSHPPLFKSGSSRSLLLRKFIHDLFCLPCWGSLRSDLKQRRRFDPKSISDYTAAPSWTSIMDTHWLVVNLRRACALHASTVFLLASSFFVGICVFFYNCLWILSIFFYNCSWISSIVSGAFHPWSGFSSWSSFFRFAIFLVKIVGLILSSFGSVKSKFGLTQLV